MKSAQKTGAWKTPIPSYTGEIEIFSTDKKHFLTCVDKLSKFSLVQLVLSRTIVDVTGPLLQHENLFPKIRTIYCDNDAAFNSETISSLLKNSYHIDIVNAVPLHSLSDKVDRFHSTLTDKKISDTVELILRATMAEKSA